MNVFKDIAARLSDEQMATLMRFRDADEPLPAEVNDLPMGFLKAVGVDDAFRVLHVLSPFGKCVALAAQQLAAEDAAE